MDGPMPNPSTLDEEGDDDVVSSSGLSTDFQLLTVKAFKCSARESQA